MQQCLHFHCCLLYERMEQTLHPDAVPNFNVAEGGGHTQEYSQGKVGTHCVSTQDIKNSVRALNRHSRTNHDWSAGRLIGCDAGEVKHNWQGGRWDKCGHLTIDGLTDRKVRGGESWWRHYRPTRTRTKKINSKHQQEQLQYACVDSLNAWVKKAEENVEWSQLGWQVHHSSVVRADLASLKRRYLYLVWVLVATVNCFPDFPLLHISQTSE